jgi:hypothetical protein
VDLLEVQPVVPVVLLVDLVVQHPLAVLLVVLVEPQAVPVVPQVVLEV